MTFFMHKFCYPSQITKQVPTDLSLSMAMNEVFKGGMRLGIYASAGTAKENDIESMNEISLSYDISTYQQLMFSY